MRSGQDLSVNDEIVSILGSVDSMVFVATMQLRLLDESDHRPYVREWAQLCSNKSL